MKTQNKTFNVYFKSPSEIEFIDSFETADEAIDKANYPGLYWGRKLDSDQHSCIEVTNTITGEQILQTLTEEERELTNN